MANRTKWLGKNIYNFTMTSVFAQKLVGTLLYYNHLQLFKPRTYVFKYAQGNGQGTI